MTHKNKVACHEDQGSMYLQKICSAVYKCAVDKCAVYNCAV